MSTAAVAACSCDEIVLPIVSYGTVFVHAAVTHAVCSRLLTTTVKSIMVLYSVNCHISNNVL